MAIDALEKHKLKKFVKNLKQFKGRHTELVSVYVPAGYDLVKISQHLAEEQGTATNIKSSATRKNVIAALEKMIQHLKIIGKNPPNGLAVFSGNISEQEGKTNVQVWSIVPPIPLKLRIYRCAKEFVTDPLEDMMETKEVYGLVVMDRREATIGLLKGKTIVVLQKKGSNVPGKTRAGGQSSQRFSRLREGAALEFYKKVAELMKKEFLNRDGMKGILVGGPGPTKNDLIEKGHITDHVKQKIIVVKDIGNTDESGLEELVEKCRDVLASEEIAGEKNIVNKLLLMLSKEPDKVSYGLDQVKQALNMGAVETLLISETLEEEVTEELEEVAKQFKTEVMIISTETREGIQLRDLGKVAAILRFPLSS